MCVSVVSHISLANPDPHFSPSDTCNNSTKGCCNLNCLQCFEILRLKRGKSKVFTLCVPKLLHQAGLGSLEQEDIAARVLWFSGNSGLKVLFAQRPGPTLLPVSFWVWWIFLLWEVESRVSRSSDWPQTLQV